MFFVSDGFFVKTMISLGGNKKENLFACFYGKYFLFTLAIFFGVFFFIHNVSAAETPSLGGQIVNGIGAGLKLVGHIAALPFLWVFNILLYALFVVQGLLLLLAGILMDWAINPDNFAIVITNNTAIYESWKLVRDILNIFFIFFLLFAAFATVFQIDKYNYKKIVLQLVIMALLVNFSFPISRFIVDVANVFFYGILSLGGFGGGLSATLAQGFNIWMMAAPSSGLIDGVINASTLTIKLVFSNIFVFILAVTFLTIGALFIIRIAILALLIIFSPVGFVAGIFPGTKQFADQWWSQLFNQAFFAPVMALVLVIALSIMRVMNNGSLLNSIKKTMSGRVLTGDYSGIITSGAMMAIPVIILWVGLLSAKKFGAIGADIVQKYAMAGMKWAVKTPVMWGGRKYERKMADNKYSKYTKWLAPSVLKGAYDNWRKESFESDRKPVEKAAAYMQDAFNKLYGRNTNHGFRVSQQQDNKVAKELLEISANSEYLVNELDAAYKNGDREEINGAILALAKTNNPNDALAAAVGKDYGQGLETEDYEYKDENGKTIKGKTAVISSKNYQILMSNLLKRAGYGAGTEEMAMAKMAIGEVARSAGNSALFAQAGFKDGKWREFSPQEQAEVVRAKLDNTDPQLRERETHPDTIFKYVYINGKRHIRDVNDEVGVAALSVVGGGDIANVVNRGRPDKKLGIVDLEGMEKTPEWYQKALDKNPMLKEYGKTITDSYKPKDSGSGGKSDKTSGLKPESFVM